MAKKMNLGDQLVQNSRIACPLRIIMFMKKRKHCCLLVTENICDNCVTWTCCEECMCKHTKIHEQNINMLSLRKLYKHYLHNNSLIKLNIIYSTISMDSPIFGLFRIQIMPHRI